MAISPAIITVLEMAFTGLTPWERWAAARGFGEGYNTEDVMVFLCAGVLVVLIALFSWVSFARVKRERKEAGKSFEDYARQRGLSERESQILMIVANKAGLKRPESVFTIRTAFGLGAARLIEEGLNEGQSSEATEQLKTEIGFLREKLGFGGPRPPQNGRGSQKTEKLSTRDIPVGKKLYVTRRKGRASSDIDSEVVRNTDNELGVRLSQPVKVVFGETWCVRYYSGASVWEFDTTVVSYDGDTLALNHSDNVRFVNRRRFLRVPVHLPGYVARFPFSRQQQADHTSASQQEQGSVESPETSAPSWGPPEFSPVVVTELAGPGLRVNSTLEIKENERVIVVLGLDEGEAKSGDAGQAGSQEAVKVIQDVGEVRHVERKGEGFSIAIELTGPGDQEVDELVRATNAALLQSNSRQSQRVDSASESEPSKEPSVAQGV